VHDTELEAATVDDLRTGLRLSVASIGWTVTTSALAIGIGLAFGSLVLVAFGFVGALDSVGSTALVVHFRHALRHETFSERHERVALTAVTVGLILVGLATLVESGRRLAYRAHGSTVPAGVALAGVSALVLAALAWRKGRVGRAIPSRALVADGWLSATGALLAIVTVAGTGLAAAYGWWWVDAGAAALVGLAAIGAGVAMRRG
jgi:divalent metal cation (Fe/Co/Zn/Cd) transporter